MPVYEFRCGCGNVEARTRPEPVRCRMCGGVMRRVYSFAVKRPMQEHWNHSVGQPIRSEKQFRDALKRKSEEMTERTGVLHDYQPVDITDRESLGVTED